MPFGGQTRGAKETMYEMGKETMYKMGKHTDDIWLI